MHVNRPVIVTVKPEFETIFFKDNRHAWNLLDASSESDIFLRTSAMSGPEPTARRVPGAKRPALKVPAVEGSLDRIVRKFSFYRAQPALEWLLAGGH